MLNQLQLLDMTIPRFHLAASIILSLTLLLSVAPPGFAEPATPATPSSVSPAKSISTQMPPSAMIQKLENGEKVTIVMLGTSLTGGEWRWVRPFREWMNKDFPGLVTIHNLGVGASASMTVPIMKGNRYTWKRCGLDRVQEAIKLKPDTVFIEFAMNDCHTPYGISIEQSKKNLNAMIDIIWKANPKTEVIVQNMNSVMNRPGDKAMPATTRKALEAYYDMYEQVARKRGIRLINHFPIWRKLMQENPEEFFRFVTDGIHPTEAGYSKHMIPTMKTSLYGTDGKRSANKRTDLQ